MQRKAERVLLVESDPRVARRVARRIRAEGGDATIARTVAEACSAPGPFDRGVLAFNLPDGNGIVLAAELMLEDRVGTVEFLHPDEARLEQGEHPSGMHTAAPAVGIEEGARQVA
jgi:hypothetical protein